MRSLLLSLLLVPLTGLASGEDRKPPEKKDPIAELEGTWKNDAMVVNGRQFKAVVLTIKPDGKARSTYMEKKGARFTLGTAEMHIKLAKVEGAKEKVRVIDNYLGVQWMVRRHSPTELIATAFYSTDAGPTAMDFSFKKVPVEPAGTASKSPEE